MQAPPPTSPPINRMVNGASMENQDHLFAGAYQPVLLNYRQLASLIGRPAASVQSEAYRNPRSLPPRVVIPGRAGLWWRLQDVHDWAAGLTATTTPPTRTRQPRPAQPAAPRRGAPGKAERIRAAELGITVKELRAREGMGGAQ